LKFISVIMKNMLFKGVGYFLDMFWFNQNDGGNCCIHSWKLFKCCLFF